MQEHVLRVRTFQSKAHCWQKSWCRRVVVNLVYSHSFANSTVVIMTLFAITNYHWPICWIICFILFVRLSFPHWLWRRVIQYTKFWLSVRGVCDRSAEVGWIPTFAFVGGSVLPYTRFVIALWIVITFYILLSSLFCICFYKEWNISLQLFSDE
jgi:hypothetical protein